eukprot:8480610-Pyramimonas_sp.AAC.1
MKNRPRGRGLDLWGSRHERSHDAGVDAPRFASACWLHVLAGASRPRRACAASACGAARRTARCGLRAGRIGAAEFLGVQSVRSVLPPSPVPRVRSVDPASRAESLSEKVRRALHPQ